MSASRPTGDGRGSDNLGVSANSSSAHVDLAVIGGGMGGLVAVREARRRGASVALFELGQLGGT